MHNYKATTSILALSMALAACGTSTPRPSTPRTTPPVIVTPPDPPTTPTAATFRTAEFNRAGEGWSPYSVIGADHAYADGYTGEGVTIAFIDFNFDFDSTDLVYNPGSRPADPEFQALYDAQFVDDVETSPHAHAVASFAAGNKNNDGIHGVAFNANVLAVDFFSGVNETIEVIDGITWHTSNPYTYVTGRGAKIVNTSLGYDEEALDDPIPTDTTDGGGNTVPITDKYNVASSVYVLLNEAMLVVSAGNDGDPDPSLSVLRNMQLAADNDLLTGAGVMMIVGGVDSSIVGNEDYDCSGVLACPNVFDRAGNKTVTDSNGFVYNIKDYYITAPGAELVFPWIFDGEPGMAAGGGTSFSAPMVAGAAAIVMQKWPHLSPHEVADVLFMSATDIGAPGTDEIYGRGLLNIEAALQPIGASSLSVSGSSMFLAPMQATMFMGPAFGDARPMSLDGTMPLTDVMVMDSLERDFYFDMSPAIFDQSQFTSSLFDVMESDRSFDAASANFGIGVMGLYVKNDLMSEGVFEAQSQHFKDTSKRQELAAASFSGEFQNFDWKVGTGFGLNAGFKGPSSREAGVATLISSQENRGYFSNEGTYASLTYYLKDGFNITGGIEVAETKGYASNMSLQLREDAKRYTSAIQISKVGNWFNIMMRAGTLFENDAVLGSRSSGGFRLADKSITGFVSTGAEVNLGNKSSLSFVMNAGKTDVNATSNSMFQGINKFITTSWSFGFTQKELFRDGDSLKFSVYQPLRVENAEVTIDKATGLNYTTRQPIYETKTYGLAPTGREVAIEAAYRMVKGAWSMQASLMYRHNSGHRLGDRTGAGMLWVKRTF